MTSAAAAVSACRNWRSPRCSNIQTAWVRSDFPRVHGVQQHNVYLQAFLVYGWAGGMAYITLLVATLWMALRTVFVRTPWQPYLICAFAAFVGEVLEGFVIDTDHWRHFFLLLGMIWGLAAATLNYARLAPIRRGGSLCRRLIHALRTPAARAHACGAGSGSVCRRTPAQPDFVRRQPHLSRRCPTPTRRRISARHRRPVLDRERRRRRRAACLRRARRRRLRARRLRLEPGLRPGGIDRRRTAAPLAPGAGSLIVHHNGPYLPHALWALGRCACAAAASSAIGPGSCRGCRTDGGRVSATCTKSGCRAPSRATPSPPPPTSRCMWCRIRCRR